MTKSKLKPISYGLLTILSLVLIYFSLYLFYNLLFDFQELKDEPWPILITLVPLTAIFFSIETIRNGRRFQVKSKGIYFNKFLSPDSLKHYSWKDFKHFITVDEQTNSGAKEAIWLIKKDNSFIRISGFYVKNYTELKEIISENLEFKENKHFNQFKLLWLLIRMKL